MTKKVMVKTKIYDPKTKYIDTAFNLPESACDYLDKNKFHLELVQFTPEFHGIYVVNESNEDVVSVSFRPHPDNVKNAMKRVFTKLSIIDEGEKQ